MITFEFLSRVIVQENGRQPDFDRVGNCWVCYCRKYVTSPHFYRGIIGRLIFAGYTSEVCKTYERQTKLTSNPNCWIGLELVFSLALHN